MRGGVADLCVVILQVIYVIQHPTFVFSIFQQGTYIQHIVQVCLDLDMQLLTLRLLQILVRRFIVDITASHTHKSSVIYCFVFFFFFFFFSCFALNYQLSNSF